MLMISPLGDLEFSQYTENSYKNDAVMCSRLYICEPESWNVSFVIRV